MFDLQSIAIYSLIFISLFFEIFVLLTFLENKTNIKNNNEKDSDHFPSATVVVPCFNEEESIYVTVESLLALDYPKDKLSITIVDDGSTDKSWSYIQKYKNHPQIKIYKKENGGKHTALNLAISQSSSEIIGCLDADSLVDSQALKNIAFYFKNEKTMAVTPAIKIYKPDNILRKVQKVEYDWGIFLRKILSLLDALYVTPGPFSFFRREVFINLGPYKKAHNTEDMEMAMRMQTNGYKIENCHTAFVYTIAPNRFSKLFKQRLRWTYGFLKNAIDYRRLFFNKKYGHLGLFIMPLMIVSVFSTLWLATSFILNIINSLGDKINNWQSLNFDLNSLKISLNHFRFEWFYLDISTITFLSILSLILMITFVLIGRKISEGKIQIKIDLLYFFIIYPLITPFWLVKSVYNVIAFRKTAWR